MKRRLLDGNVIVFRAIAVTGLAAAFLFALVLSVAPQLHEQIHQPSDATHQCVVTLLTAGNCHYPSCDSIATTLQPPAPSSGLFHSYFEIASRCPEFSLLEHAPPAIS
jgi:hypothetical protein